MSRRRTIWLVVAAVLLVLGGVFLWALPELIRRQAVTQIPKITGRAASIGDIDLNLFTGRLVVKNFRLAERDPQKAFVEFERLEARWSWSSLLAAHIRWGDSEKERAPELALLAEWVDKRIKEKWVDEKDIVAIDCFPDIEKNQSVMLKKWEFHLRFWEFQGQKWEFQIYHGSSKSDMGVSKIANRGYRDK